MSLGFIKEFHRNGKRRRRAAPDSDNWQAEHQPQDIQNDNVRKPLHKFVKRAVDAEKFHFFSPLQLCRVSLQTYLCSLFGQNCNKNIRLTNWNLYSKTIDYRFNVFLIRPITFFVSGSH